MGAKVWEEGERATGFEPVTRAWKALVLPLHHARVGVGEAGFEPTTSWTQTKRATELRYSPALGNRKYSVLVGWRQK